MTVILIRVGWRLIQDGKVENANSIFGGSKVEKANSFFGDSKVTKVQKDDMVRPCLRWL